MNETDYNTILEVVRGNARFRNINRFVSTAISLLCAVIIIALRFSSNVAAIPIGGIFFSVTDFFLIIAAGLCGYRYGLLTSLVVMVVEFMSGRNIGMGFPLFIYVMLGVVVGYMSRMGVFASIKKTAAAAGGLILLLGSSWYLMFLVLGLSVRNFYQDMPVLTLYISAAGEVILACLFLYLFMRYAPDNIKQCVGIAYIYTAAHRKIASIFFERKSSVIGDWVTGLSLAQAVVISVLSAFLADMTVNNLLSGDIPPGYNPVTFYLQLIFQVMCVALPISLAVNGVLQQYVVMPIMFLSSGIRNFRGDEHHRNLYRHMLESMTVDSKNEIGLLHRSLVNMLDNFEDYLKTKEREESLKTELQVAEARTQAKSDFLSSMSHEIRTPINAVLGMNEMILRETEEEQTAVYAENIRSAGSTLLSLVNDILDFSKIEAGKMEIIPVDYELSSLFNDLVNMISPRAQEKGLQMLIKINPEIPNFLHGDEIRLKQIITNILTNAVKYTKEGSVTLEAEYRRLPQEIELTIGVRDTGIGIKPENIQNLFTAFERIEEERNRTIEGTGLGINITQKFLKLMGSTLEVESEYGKGSYFFFKLRQGVTRFEPIGDYQKAFKYSSLNREKYSARFIAPGASVLVVDDTEMNLSVFKSLLKHTQVQRDTAISGQECLETGRQKRYDLIFLDHKMPGKDGIETLHEMREDAQSLNRDTPVVCLTANAISGAREQYREAGFDDYLTKPIDSAALEKLMARMLPQDKVLPPDEGQAADQNGPDAGKPLDGVGLLQALKDIPEGLRRIDGVDIISGISLMGGSVADYLEAVKIYHKGIRGNLREIEGFFEASDWDNYTIKVHALKSSSRIIGAYRIGDLAAALEEAGNNRDLDLIRGKTHELLDLYGGMGEALDCFNEAKDDGKPLIDKGVLQEAYAAIKEFSLSFDYDAVESVMKDLMGYRVPEEESERFKKLEDAVFNVDWPGIDRALEGET